MKKLILLSALFISFLTFAQVPQGISYQAIALNGSGAPVVSSNVRVRLSVLDVSATGTVLYSETQLKTTNPQGLFNLVIGQGTVVSGVFASINWATNSKFLKVEMDVTGGTTYVLVGTTQLLSVPYALMAGGITGSGANESIENNKFSNYAFADSSAGKVYAFNQSTGAWVMQNGYADTGTLQGSGGNFCFSDSSAGKVYVFNQNTSSWVFQNGYADNGLTYSNGNFAFTDSSAGKVYAFNKTTGTWILQNGYADSMAGSKGNFAFVDSSAGKVYAFNKNTGTWVMQNGYADGEIRGENGSFIFTDSSAGKTYVFNKNTGTWVVQNGYADGGSNGLIISGSNDH
ncbi:hypothetical protein [Flavobacterium terrisoli]|uniref:hypothetical protein n=1 Tax=Flavobacterium terrisoli TaxID=3242195 RepID=UPI00254388F9|nr:hypothetical protein [Flavobacterium buctense]